MTSPITERTPRPEAARRRLQVPTDLSGVAKGTGRCGETIGRFEVIRSQTVVAKTDTTKGASHGNHHKGSGRPAARTAGIAIAVILLA
jgi:hypothetical protein